MNQIMIYQLIKKKKIIKILLYFSINICFIINTHEKVISK